MRKAVWSGLLLIEPQVAERLTASEPVVVVLAPQTAHQTHGGRAERRLVDARGAVVERARA